jgi:glycosyltransferase involved in cell wall biosynthesis
MTVTYALLSPTYGMHLYTAGLARRARDELGQRVRLVTTQTAPLHCYDPTIPRVTPFASHGTGFAPEGLDAAAYRVARAALVRAAGDGPVHFTGVHLWNLPLIHALRRHGATVVHSLHDLSPHGAVRHGALIRLWNRLLIDSGATLLVHGERYRKALLQSGVAPNRVRAAPLTHGFWRDDSEPAARDLASQLAVRAGRDDDRRVILFFGRIERYKGVDTLMEAWRTLAKAGACADNRLVIAGRCGPGVSLPTLPPRAELRDRHIDDAEAFELFRRTALLVLPYRDATQTALVAAAGRFSVPTLATDTGAMSEYVQDGVTGWLVPPADPSALAQALGDALAHVARLDQMGEAAREWYQAARGRELATLTDLRKPVPPSAQAARRPAHGPGET